MGPIPATPDTPCDEGVRTMSSSCPGANWEVSARFQRPANPDPALR